jgi:hypothetical protein
MAKHTVKTSNTDRMAVLPAEVTVKEDTFKITVKVEEWKSGDDVPEEAFLKDGVAVWYFNEAEKYQYHEVPSLPTALQYFGATLSDDQIAFLGESLKGEGSGEACKEIVDIVNASLKLSAAAKRRSALVNQYSPMTDQNMSNAHASIVRNVVKTKGFSPEVAIKGLIAAGLLPDTYTVADFSANKGKR